VETSNGRPALHMSVWLQRSPWVRAWTAASRTAAYRLYANSMRLVALYECSMPLRLQKSVYLLFHTA